MTPPSLPVLVAVSGGSDSTALLLRLREAHGNDQLFAATVDHGLRAEAADEARRVEDICRSLGISHTTLRWSGDRKAAASARAARYDLLTGHAKDIGATIIALGHTMDDQAETVFMRAMRLQPHSNTRGLSGMTVRTHHHGLTLWRPLLETRRAMLREELTAKGQDWIEDPSNSDVTGERVRVRRSLQNQPRLFEHLARFAAANNRSRTWLACRTADAIPQHVEQEEAGSGYLISRIKLLDRLILREILSVLVLTVGGGNYRPALHKLEPLLVAAESGQRLRHAVGRTIVTINHDRITVEPETRRRSLGAQTNPIEPAEILNAFRSNADDAIADALRCVRRMARQQP